MFDIFFSANVLTVGSFPYIIIIITASHNLKLPSWKINKFGFVKTKMHTHTYQLNVYQYTNNWIWCFIGNEWWYAYFLVKKNLRSRKDKVSQTNQTKLLFHWIGNGKQFFDYCLTLTGVVRSIPKYK